MLRTSGVAKPTLITPGECNTVKENLKEEIVAGRNLKLDIFVTLEVNGASLPYLKKKCYNMRLNGGLIPMWSMELYILIDGF